jgi:hypothetical protein
MIKGPRAPACRGHARGRLVAGGPCRGRSPRSNGRRPGYLHRVLAAMRSGAMPANPCVHHCANRALIERAASTAARAATDISVSGPDGVVVVDESRRRHEAGDCREPCSNEVRNDQANMGETMDHQDIADAPRGALATPC